MRTRLAIKKNVLFFLFFLIVIACGNDGSFSVPNEDNNVELVDITFNFGLLPETRVAGAITGEDDNYVDNMWIFQYTADGNTLKQVHYLNVHENRAMAPLEAEVGEQYKILCLANTNDHELFASGSYTGFSTISELTAMTKQLYPLTAEKSMWYYVPGEGMEARPSLLMRGSARSNQSDDPGGIDNVLNQTVEIIPGVTTDLHVQLYRLCARVSFNCENAYTVNDIPNFFNIVSVRLKNVPSKLSYFDNAVLMDGDYIDYVSEIVENTQANTGENIFTWYIPRHVSQSEEATQNSLYIEVIGVDKANRITTYRFYPHTESSGVYHFDLEAGYSYGYKAKIQGAADKELSQQKHYSVKSESAKSYISDIPSNCYMVLEGKPAIIPLTQVNEFNRWLANASNYPDYIMDDDTKWSAEILWMDKPGLVTLLKNSGKGITDEFFVVKPKDVSTQGNAVVVMRDEQGTVLWCWHIWVLAGEVGTRTYIPHNRADGILSTGTRIDDPDLISSGDIYKVLLYNLGATASGFNEEAYGLYYQFGRHIPFTAQTSAYGTNGIFVFGTLSFSAEPEKPALYSLQNLNSYFTNYGWYGSARAESWTKSDGSKTVFDPCPKDYMVPPIEFFAGELTNSWNISSFTNGYNWNTLKRRVGDEDIFEYGPGQFPANGYKNTPTLTNVASGGYYWSNKYHSAAYAYGFQFTSNSVTQSAAGRNNGEVASLHGRGIRCVKKEN